MKRVRDERVDSGKLKTWEWNGTVRNDGIKVGGCTTEVMVINVGDLLSWAVLVLTRGTGQDFFEFNVRVRKANGEILEYHLAQPIDMVTQT